MEEFLSKDIAAARLGLSIRRLVDLVERSGIKGVRRFDPRTRRWAATFAAGDIEKLAQERESTPVSEDIPALRPASKNLPAVTAPPAAAIQPPLAATPPLWLTLAEASRTSGLPEPVLVRLVRSGKLRALDVGVRPGGRFRIRARDLAEIEGDLFDLPPWVTPVG